MQKRRLTSGIIVALAAAVCAVGAARPARAGVPTGACCLIDVGGTCQDAVTEGECGALGGDYRGDGTDCTTLGGGNPANACLGACCRLALGSCTANSTKLACEADYVVSVGPPEVRGNGIFQGYNTACGPDTCPALTGACCAPDGSCQVRTLQECQTIVNGFFNGVGTTCATAVCTGGCCLPDGSCITGVTYNDCCNAPNDGFFRGYATDCTSPDCPQAGACCFTDGSCLSLTPADCDAGGGSYQGSGVDCGSAGCTAVTGACLQPLGVCSVMNKVDCERSALYTGTGAPTYWIGPGTSCPTEGPYYLPGGGQVNMAGATLFADFSAIAGSTNDFINVSPDVIRPTGYPYNRFRDSDGDCFADAIQQLAPTYICPPGIWWGQWLVNYRSVGSLNGVNEFIDYQLLGIPGYKTLTERGVLNRVRYSDVGGVPTGLIRCPANCHPDTCGDLNGDGMTNALDVQDMADAIVGLAAPAPENGEFTQDGVVDIDDVFIFLECVLNKASPLVESATPVCVETIDMASTDVPMAWVVRLPGTPAWNRKPTSAGYGNNPVKSTTGFDQRLVSLERAHPVEGPISLNVNVTMPDSQTVFDNTIAISPVCAIANRGTGKRNVTYSELQHHWVSGRFPNGENLVAATRDAGSGTRNACNNALGIDPSWGGGDNIGNQSTVNDETRLGPLFQPTNCGGSGLIEQVVEYNRLAIGYTGYFGGSRAADDAFQGRYEILNIKKDVAGGTEFVRPTLNSILDNCNINTGYQVTASQTLATLGDPFDDVTGNPPMPNPAARDYLRNLFVSIQQFSAAPFTDTSATPAQALTRNFVLEAAVDCIPSIADPLTFNANPNFAQGAQDAVRATNVTFTPAYGSRNAAGRVPTRKSGEVYSDNTVANQSYRLPNGNHGAPWTAGATIPATFTRMRIAGDFNADGKRDWDDIPALMQAVNNPLAFEAADAALFPNNYIVPEIMGDFDGDGNFGDSTTSGAVGTNAITPNEMRDARYFADGLALDPVTGRLNRKQGFIRVDTAWQAIHAGDSNFFNTTLATGAAYAAGDSRGDVAGNSPSPGAKPTGADGVVNAQDVDYVSRNFISDWSDLNAVTSGGRIRDLSADMDGDLDVDCDDVAEIVIGILKTTLTDLNLSGSTTAADVAIACANLGETNATWSQGDVNCDGQVTQSDIDAIAAAAGASNVCP